MASIKHMCLCSDGDGPGKEGDNTQPTTATRSRAGCTQWTYVPGITDRMGTPWQRFVSAPRVPWYGVFADVPSCIIAFTTRTEHPQTWGVVTTLSTEDFSSTPAGALHRYITAHATVAVPYFREDGAALVVNHAGHIILLQYDQAEKHKLRATSITKAAAMVVTAPAYELKGTITSSIGRDATFVTYEQSDSDDVYGGIPGASDETWESYKRYGNVSVPWVNDELVTDSKVVNHVVYNGEIVLLPESMHAVWLPSPTKALLVVQYGRAIVVLEDILVGLSSSKTNPGSSIGVNPLVQFLTTAFVSYVSYEVPELTSNAKYYKPIVPLTSRNVYVAVIVSGKGEAALLRIRGAFSITTVNINSALTRPLQRRVTNQQYVPGDVLFEYKTEGLYLVCTSVPGTAVLRPLDPASGKLGAPKRYDTRNLTKWIGSGQWSLLPPAIADVSVTEKLVWVLAGNTRYRTHTALIHDEGHTIHACGSFSVSHTPESIGGDDVVSWVTMAPEPRHGLPIALCLSAATPAPATAPV